jgi:formate dehydrogenase major subunit
VDLDGELVRACATAVSQDMSILTATERAKSARTEAFDRILTNHLLYCTVCDNNNGNCTVHNTTKMQGVEHQSIPFKTKPITPDS